MTDHPKNGGYASATELRKQLLITQGAMFRSGLVISREKLKSGLQAKSLTGGAIKHIGMAALSALRSRSGIATATATGLPALVPLLFRGASKLLGRAGWKPLAGGTLIAGVAAAAIYFMRAKSAGAESSSGRGDEAEFDGEGIS